MSTVNVLLTIAIGSLVAACLIFVAQLFLKKPMYPEGLNSLRYAEKYSDPRYLDYMAQVSRRNIVRNSSLVSCVVLVVGAVALFFVIGAFGSYFAGQGDAVSEARTWAAKWAPGAEVECQARDSDSNGYVSCTVGTPGGKIEAIECGVNRWYQGWRTTGCRLMKGYSGSQP